MIRVSCYVQRLLWKMLNKGHGDESRKMWSMRQKWQVWQLWHLWRM
jgi:hypothetical protein